MTHRLLAVLGSVAFGIRQFVGALLSFVGLRELSRFAVPLLVLLLGVAAITSARETAAVLASRPDVQETTLAEVASREELTGSVWFQFDAVMAETHLPTPADLGAFFYLARDPEQPELGLLVRSALNDAFIRQRVLSARIVEDEGFVASALEALPPLPAGFDLEGARYLDELEAGGERDAAFVPSQLDEEGAGTELLVAGRVVTPISHSACATPDGCDGPDAAWLYYLADPEGPGAIVLRSPHPPQAIPVRLQGLYLRDTFDLAPVIESDWYADLDAEVPTDRALFAESQPPITVEASWTPPIAYGTLALLLLASHLVGYPVFGGRAAPAARRTLEPGEAIDLEITGRLARGGTRAVTLDRSPGALERLSIPDLALRMWRYGLLPRDLSRREAEERFIAEAAGEHDRLVVHERDQSALVVVDRDRGSVRVEAGRLYRLAGSAPAIHLRVGETDAYLTTGSVDTRDRVASEIRGEAESTVAPAPEPAVT